LRELPQLTNSASDDLKADKAEAAVNP